MPGRAMGLLRQLLGQAGLAAPTRTCSNPKGVLTHKPRTHSNTQGQTSLQRGSRPHPHPHPPIHTQKPGWRPMAAVLTDAHHVDAQHVHPDQRPARLDRPASAHSVAGQLLLVHRFNGAVAARANTGQALQWSSGVHPGFSPAIMQNRADAYLALASSRQPTRVQFCWEVCRRTPGEAQLQFREVAAPHLSVAHQPEGNERAKRDLHGGSEGRAEGISPQRTEGRQSHTAGPGCGLFRPQLCPFSCHACQSLVHFNR